MASPVGHAIVGLGAAVVAARVGQVPVSGQLLAGALVACGAPDLDVVFVLAGKDSMTYHRKASHSLIIMSVVAVVGMWVVVRTGWVSPPVFGVWIVAFFTHPLLDVMTTTPADAAKGWGIPLFWPISRRRFVTSRPIVELIDVTECRSMHELWNAVRPEIAMFGTASVVATLLAMLFFP